MQTSPPPPQFLTTPSRNPLSNTKKNHLTPYKNCHSPPPPHIDTIVKQVHNNQTPNQLPPCQRTNPTTFPDQPEGSDVSQLIRDISLAQNISIRKRQAPHFVRNASSQPNYHQYTSVPTFQIPQPVRSVSPQPDYRQPALHELMRAPRPRQRRLSELQKRWTVQSADAPEFDACVFARENGMIAGELPPAQVRKRRG